RKTVRHRNAADRDRRRRRLGLHAPRTSLRIAQSAAARSVVAAHRLRSGIVVHRRGTRDDRRAASHRNAPHYRRSFAASHRGTSNRIGRAAAQMTMTLFVFAALALLPYAMFRGRALRRYNAADAALWALF